MAVQKSRKSRSRRGMRRAHDHLSEPTLSHEHTTGELHLRHHISANGYYRGKAYPKLIERLQREKAQEEE